MNWPSYLIQVNIYLILFYAFYELVLKNETFFKWNRIFLLASGVLSFIIPAVQSDWVRSMFVTKEIEQVTYVIAVSPVITLSAPAATDSNLSLMEWLSIIYLSGALFFLCRFIWQLSKVNRSFKEGSRAQSFFTKIKVSEDLPSRESIVKHEKVHASQLHSADVIFFELINIINWFNPVVYGYKRSVKFIHEFIADEVASAEKGKSDYALLLVSNVFGIRKEQLTNNFFNQSLLKKRVMMLYKTKSRKTALLKYGLAAPLFASMVIFSSATIKSESLTKIESSIEAASELKITGNKEIFIQSTAGTVQTEAVSNEDILAKSEKPRLAEIIQPEIDRDSSLLGVAEVETMPRYPGGMEAFYKWIGKEYKFPKEAQTAKVSGRLIVTFVVEKDGTLTNIRVLRDLKHGTGEEAVRLLSSSQKWLPGIQNGKPVRVQYTLPLMLNYESNEKNSEDKKGLSTPSQPNGPVFRAGVNPVIFIDGKRFQKDIPSGFNFGTATEAEYADLLGIKASDIRSISVTKNDDGSTNGTLSITTAEGIKGKNVRIWKPDPSHNLSLRINGSNLKEKPLYILDGKEITSEQFQKIQPSRIEAISVQKDSAATAIYGEKGKNGVIIITSKK
ncbi:energy transducer TonB [Paradesertivirga mongoliensis]|uniref:Energy transducer TonB n=1 Tax=Paradesertivirga mongoliensis TaxID=2100740 RepID=A0ABW4ZH25_9SPHI|nr:energy transducer TonB [Pedobacter mongoliensis]